MLRSRLPQSDEYTYRGDVSTVFKVISNIGTQNSLQTGENEELWWPNIASNAGG
jgi:hypothetical protein